MEKISLKNKIHIQPANIEKLYLPRKEIGRRSYYAVDKKVAITLKLFKKFCQFKKLLIESDAE